MQIIIFFQCCLIFLGYVTADPTCTDRLADPCVCITVSYSMTCDGVSTGANLKTTFSTKPATTVDSIQIAHAPELTSLPAEVFGLVKTNTVIIERTNLSSIDDNAFLGSEDVLETIILRRNNLESFNFKLLTNLKKLIQFRLEKDKLTEVPQEAFSNLPLIMGIDLEKNNITSIQNNAFHNLPSIRDIDLYNNKLTAIGDHVFNLGDTKNAVIVNLNWNKISSITPNAFKDLKVKFLWLQYNKLETLAQSTFEPILDDLNTFGTEEGMIYVEGNPIKCNSSIRWLVTKSASYKRPVHNFQCHSSDKTFDRLTESDLSD